MLKNLILVVLGGGTGAGLRYLVSIFLNNPKNGFPYATFTVNLLGCLLLGALAGLVMKNGNVNQNPVFLLLGIGVLGGFTTFSSFSLDSIKLLQAGNTTYFLIYVIGTNALGILLGYLGLKIAGNI